MNEDTPDTQGQSIGAENQWRTNEERRQDVVLRILEDAFPGQDRELLQQTSARILYAVTSAQDIYEKAAPSTLRRHGFNKRYDKGRLRSIEDLHSTPIKYTGMHTSQSPSSMQTSRREMELYSPRSPAHGSFRTHNSDTDRKENYCSTMNRQDAHRSHLFIDEMTTATSPLGQIQKRSPSRKNPNLKLDLENINTHDASNKPCEPRNPNSPNQTELQESNFEIASDDEMSMDDYHIPKQAKVPTKWTNEEDEDLRSAVEQIGARNWKRVAELVPGRDHVQCLQRWNKVLRPGLIKGPWTPEEDERLTYLVSEEKLSAWKEIASKIVGRTPKQCRERWKLNLDPAINRSPFTPAEDEHLLQLHADMGNRWAEIKVHFAGRTENAVKTRFKSLMRSRAREWTPEQDSELLALYSKHKDDLPAIVGHFNGRTKTTVRMRLKQLTQGTPVKSNSVREVSSAGSLSHRPRSRHGHQIPISKYLSPLTTCTGHSGQAPRATPIKSLRSIRLAATAARARGSLSISTNAIGQTSSNEISPRQEGFPYQQQQQQQQQQQRQQQHYHQESAAPEILQTPRTVRRYGAHGEEGLVSPKFMHASPSLESGFHHPRSTNGSPHMGSHSPIANDDSAVPEVPTPRGDPTAAEALASLRAYPHVSLALPMPKLSKISSYSSGTDPSILENTHQEDVSMELQSAPSFASTSTITRTNTNASDETTVDSMCSRDTGLKCTDLVPRASNDLSFSPSLVQPTSRFGQALFPSEENVQAQKIDVQIATVSGEKRKVQACHTNLSPRNSTISILEAPPHKIKRDELQLSVQTNIARNTDPQANGSLSPLDLSLVINPNTEKMSCTPPFSHARDGPVVNRTFHTVGSAAATTTTTTTMTTTTTTTLQSSEESIHQREHQHHQHQHEHQHHALLTFSPQPSSSSRDTDSLTYADLEPFSSSPQSLYVGSEHRDGHSNNDNFATPANYSSQRAILLSSHAHNKPSANLGYENESNVLRPAPHELQSLTVTPTGKS